MNNVFIKVLLLPVVLIINSCATSTGPLQSALSEIYAEQKAKELASNINFPAHIALLAYGGTDKAENNSSNDWMTGLIDSADQKGELTRLNITKEKAKTELDNIFVSRSCAVNSPDGGVLRSELTQIAIESGSGNLGVKPSELREAVELIDSGQFYRDISSSVLTVAKVFPKLANKLILNPPKLSDKFHDSFDAIRQDFKDNPSAIQCLDNLKKQETCESPKVLQHTLKVLFDSPTVSVTKETVNILLEKESIRLAIILYAKSNGIDIEQEDINTVQVILNDQEPELGKFFTVAINRMIEKNGLDETKSKLETMGSNTNCNTQLATLSN